MRVKAIKDLAQRNDDDLFTELAAGIQHCLRNALNLWRDTTALSKAQRSQGAKITNFFVAEEAARCHILLDAARCPRTPPEQFTKHLGSFQQHLAKGVYAEYYTWTFHNLTDATKHIDEHLRPTYYLDGPNDVDWIFRNDILQRREETIYVDYVTNDDGSHWHQPDHRRLAQFRHQLIPAALQVGLALHHAGMTTPKALRIIADHWRAIDSSSINNRNELWNTNRETMSRLETAGLLRHRPDHTYRTILGDWKLPLYNLDLSPIDIDLNTLRTIQRTWTPWDYW